MTNLAQAEVAERAAFAAIGALGAVELDAVKIWIASGCEGRQPRPDVEARRVLTDHLAAAMDAREAAERAAGGRGAVSGLIAGPKAERDATGLGLRPVESAGA